MEAAGTLPKAAGLPKHFKLQAIFDQSAYVRERFGASNMKRRRVRY